MTVEFSMVNALWSLCLFAIVIWKIYRLRSEIHTLVESLKNLGDPFIRTELRELKTEVRSLKAGVLLIEESLGLNGSLEQG